MAPELSSDSALDSFGIQEPLLKDLPKNFPNVSLEDLHKDETFSFSEYENRSRKFSYFFAAASHFFAVIAKLIKVNDRLQDKVNKFSLGLSKLVHTLAYGSLAVDALRDDRLIDAIAKTLDPLMSNFSSIENINLTKGIAGGLGVLDFAQAGRADKVNGKKQNLLTSCHEIWKMAKEVYTPKIFSQERKIFISPKKESGHSLAFAGHLILASTSLGLLFKPLEKIMNIARNLGAVIANTVTMYHPDDQKKLSGSLFNIYAALDSVQKFLPKPASEIINNVNMGIYNIAIYYYGDLSRKRTENNFNHY